TTVSPAPGHRTDCGVLADAARVPRLPAGGGPGRGRHVVAGRVAGGAAGGRAGGPARRGALWAQTSRHHGSGMICPPAGATTSRRTGASAAVRGTGTGGV